MNSEDEVALVRLTPSEMRGLKAELLRGSQEGARQAAEEVMGKIIRLLWIVIIMLGVVVVGLLYLAIKLH